ncbi:hypothetical protein Cni_G03685 [Canna indica]|uniref:F-box/kelch-repeat protein SKIP25 n=1 Tax=Canna indica TaxID=4628 RepID=A0AAQ3Q1I2_9LILI|nr:hypothetical protein Cni_G03685 [Canna indica]
MAEAVAIKHHKLSSPETDAAASSSQQFALPRCHHHLKEKVEYVINNGEKEQQPLLPGLPDHLAQLCLSRLHPQLLFAVCRSWRRLLYSPSFPPFLSLYSLLSSDDGAAAADDADPIGFYTFDPLSAKWSPLPPPPPDPPLRCLLLRHPSFIAHSLPVQAVAAGSHLVVVAATNHRLLPAFPRPLVFHPATRCWRLGPPVRAPRRWCAAGSAGGAVYLASGVGTAYNTEVARSAERWDPAGAGAAWESVAPVRNGRFSREALEAVASQGKLCMVNVRGRAVKEGAVYDVQSDRWGEIPAGLVAGWTGPAAAAEEGGPIYVVDEERGALKAYDWATDRWAAVAESEQLKGAVQLAAGGGRACVVCGGGEAVVVVDVKATTHGRMWTVQPPAGKRVMSVHVLPRMSKEAIAADH